MHLETASTDAVVHEFLSRLGQGDPDRVADLFAERIDWALDWPAGAHPATPWIRARSTRADVADHFRTLESSHIPDHRDQVMPRVLVDGTEAVVLGTLQRTARPTGRHYTAKVALHLTVTDGLITRYHVYEDSLAVARAFG